VSVAAVDGVQLEAAEPFGVQRRGRDELVAGFEELVALARSVRSPELDAAGRAAVVERMVVLRSRLFRLAGDAIGGRDYRPIGPVPTDGFLGLGRLLGLMSALVDMGAPRAEFPCFVRLDADAVGEVRGASGAGRFPAGGRYVAERRNARGSIRVLDEEGRAMWVTAGHPWVVVGSVGAG
jgi:hypothetical protein